MMRGAFDPSALLLDRADGGAGDGGGGESVPAWPSWEEVVEIAADEDSESR